MLSSPETIESKRLSEPLLRHVIDEPVRFTFHHLEEYRVECATELRYRAYIELAAFNDETRAGLITIQLLTRTPHFDPVQQMHIESKKIESQGFHVAGAKVSPIPAITGFDRGFIYAPTAIFESHQFDAPVVLFENETHVAIASLIGPSKDESPEWWNYNRQGFQIVCNSIRIGDYNN